MKAACIKLGLLVIMSLFICAVSTCSAATKEGVVEMTLQPFDLKQVRLLDGPCKEAMEANRKYLYELDSDRLLRNFHVNAGLPAPGQPHGGWDAPDCEVRGHFTGHYLSACALMYASTGDEKLKAKADAMVTELAKCQKALGGEYLSAFPESFWDRLESLDRTPWAPYYCIHKMMAGLYDMYAICGNKQALAVLEGMASYFGKRMDKLSSYQIDRILPVEFGGMNEVLHNLHAITGKPEHLRLAQTFDWPAFLGPLALEHDNLSRIHGNTHIPIVCGAARRYELTGDERYRTVTRYFWDRIVDIRCYATGGTTMAEVWPEPNKLAGTLAVNNQECCKTYNMLRVTRYLLRWTGDIKYADYYERAFFNGILGTQEPDTGMLMYYVPLATGFCKTYGTPTDTFWCCYGTGVESFSKLGDSIYFHDDKDVYVNMFISSALDWTEKGVRIEQTTNFPEQENTALTIHCKKSVEMAINIHIPYWATKGASFKVNGKKLSIKAEPSSWAAIKRTWQDGDKVEVDVPMSLHACPLNDDPETTAIMYGPVVLAGIITPADKAHNAAPQTPVTDDDILFLGDVDNLEKWIEPVKDQPLTFRTKGQMQDITLIPLNRVVHEYYGVYWQVTQKDSPRHKEYLTEVAQKARRNERIIDWVSSKDPGIEKAHNLQGEKTAAGLLANRHWRHAEVGGWWSWDLKLLPGTQTVLLCNYWGSDVNRTFDILIDGRKLATQSLDNNKPGKFFDVEYTIPEELTKDKAKITVKFVPHEGKWAGGVFECATLKAEGNSSDQ